MHEIKSPNVGGRPGLSNMVGSGQIAPSISAPGEQRLVVHREFRIIRRISRERLQDLPQNLPHRGNPDVTKGDRHEEPDQNSI